jgi:ubiquitin-like 1-activating enzyme E1 B
VRNTPSEPVHCIVWAKMVYNTLFGPTDDDNIMSDQKIGVDDADVGGSATFAQRAFDFYFTGEICLLRVNDTRAQPRTRAHTTFARAVSTSHFVSLLSDEINAQEPYCAFLIS